MFALSIGLFAAFILNEFIVVRRAISNNTLKDSPLPSPIQTIVILLLLPLPFFIRLALPIPVAIGVIILQVIGLLAEILAEVELTKHASFGVAPDAGTTVTTSGPYAMLEHPIYLGILIQILAWSFWMPLVAIAGVGMYGTFRKAIQAERIYLATLSNQKAIKKIDTFLWN